MGRRSSSQGVLPPLFPRCRRCFLRRRRKNIADTGEIVVGAPPVFKEVGQHPSAGAHSGQPPHNEASQEAPKRCTGRRFNTLGAVNRQPWYPERRGSGWVSSPGKLVSKTPSNNAGGTPWGLLRRHRAACGARTRAQINGIDLAWGAARPLFGNSEYLLRRAWAAGFHHRGCSHH